MRLHTSLGAVLLAAASLASAASSAATRSPQPPTPPPLAIIDSIVAAKMEEVGLMGVAGMLFVDGQMVWSKGYGHRDYLRTQPFTTTTPMTVASITKTFLGASMMRLVAEGKLDLDADVNRYLPFSVHNPRFPGSPITLRMIATHTSSITDRWDVYRATYNWGARIVSHRRGNRVGEFARQFVHERIHADLHTAPSWGTAAETSDTSRNF